MKIYFPSRIVDRHVGGNTTYAVAIRDGLRNRGIETGIIPAAGNPLGTLLGETAYALRARPRGTVLHFSADTGPLLRTHAPSVVTVHGVASRWIDVARNNFQEFTWRTRVARAIGATQRVVTVSNSAADDIAEIFNVPREDIEVIYHGIDHEHFETRKAMSEDLRADIPENYVLYLGNVEPRKNLIALVDVFERPELRSLGTHLVIAGRPAWNYNEILERIKRSAFTTYLGFVSDDDRVALMQGADIFAFPSLYEGFGFPVLEAMAAGTPVVTSRRGSLAEVAGPSWQLEDLSAPGIAAGIAAALADDSWRSGVVSEGKRWARQYTWDRSTDKHVDVYRSVLS